MLHNRFETFQCHRSIEYHLSLRLRLQEFSNSLRSDEWHLNNVEISIGFNSNLMQYGSIVC